MWSYQTHSASGGRRAFTLVETLLVVALFTVLMVVLVEFFIGYYRALTYLSATVDVSSSAGAIVGEVTDAAYQADQIISTHSFSGTNYTSTSTSLVLRLPAIDSSGNQLAGKYDYFGFYATSTKAYRIIDADATSFRTDGTKLLSDTLQTMTFTYNNSDLSAATKVDINVQTFTQVKGQTRQAQLHQQVYLRNK